MMKRTQQNEFEFLGTEMNHYFQIQKGHIFEKCFTKKKEKKNPFYLIWECYKGKTENDWKSIHLKKPQKWKHPDDMKKAN